MRQIAIVSGKGGTGKTSLAAAFVRLAGRCVAVDAEPPFPQMNTWRSFCQAS